MRAIFAVAGLLVVGYALPASAYIVRDPHTKPCRIVNETPVMEKTVVNPDGTISTTRIEAETGMKTAKVCDD